MLKIGDFSKLSQVTVQALRYYDDMDLLKPCHVDAFTGYRYYSVEQLPRLNRILALKDLGFSLEQIARILNEGLSPEHLRGMLRLKQSEQQQRVREAQERLARVEARLRQIELEGSMPHYDVILKKVEPQKVASLRKTLPTPQSIGGLLQDLFVFLAAQGVAPAGPPCGVWHDPDYRETGLEAEAAIPIAQAIRDGEGIRAAELPGSPTTACIIHSGSYEGFSQAYAALLGWIHDNGYRIAGPYREIYLRGPGPEPADPGTYVTEIQVPVTKA